MAFKSFARLAVALPAKLRRVRVTAILGRPRFTVRVAAPSTKTMARKTSEQETIVLLRGSLASRSCVSVASSATAFDSTPDEPEDCATKTPVLVVDDADAVTATHREAATVVQQVADTDARVAEQLFADVPAAAMLLMHCGGQVSRRRRGANRQPTVDSQKTAIPLV